MNVRERIEAGTLSEAHARISARLGHAGAREAFPDAEVVDWSKPRQRERLVSEAMRLLGETGPARLAADWAGRVLEAWSEDDPAPAEAIAAAKAWAECPCGACTAAADAASKAADAAASALSARPNPDKAKAAKAANAASAASAAARAAVNTVGPIAVRSSTMAAVFASLAAADAAAELVWQPLRLAAYLLGEVGG